MAENTSTHANSRFHETEWMRIMRDLPSAHCMKTTRGVAIAAQAQWQQRVPDIELLRDQALHWHEVGWNPEDWWSLMGSLTLCISLVPKIEVRGRRIVNQHEQHPRECSLEIVP